MSSYCMLLVRRRFAQHYYAATTSPAIGNSCISTGACIFMLQMPFHDPMH